MKYEEIEVGESYEYYEGAEKVISKIDEYKATITVDEDGHVTAWDKDELELFQPIKKELPESGLLVSGAGSLIFRTGKKSGYGFDSDGLFMDSTWSFIGIPNLWKPATPEEEAKLIKLLKAEAEKRGLGVYTKIKSHADGGERHSLNDMYFTPSFRAISVWNKNGQIFHNGIWAEPLTMLDEVCDTIKKHLPNIVIEQIDGVVTLKQL